MVLRLLIRGHLRTRWKRYAIVATSLGIGLFGFFLVYTIADGAREAIARPLQATITGDLRVTNGTEDVAGGKTWTDYRHVASEFDNLDGVRVSPRLESTYITIRGQEYDNWSAGLLLGVLPDDPDEAHSLDPYIVWGNPVNALDAFDPKTGRSYAPIVLGKPAVKRLNLTLNASGAPNFDEILTLTSGRLQFEGNVPIPITIEGVVVGIFSTGLEPLDKFTGFLPIQTVRVLAGHSENDPVANALILHGGNVQEAQATAKTLGLVAQSPDDFAFSYMGAMLVILYAAGILGLALFFTVVLVWLVHETGLLIRQDQSVLCSLRAIGIPARQIRWSYSGLTTLAVAAGAASAFLAALLLGWFAPPMPWRMSGLKADLAWEPHPGVWLAMAGLAVAAALLVSWWTARRIQRLNILDGLRT